MCKINGHSLFTYLVQPHNAKKLANSSRRASNVAKAQQEATETILNNSEGDENATTASTAQVRKPKKNQTLSSLRTQQANSVGASLGGTNNILGLNLGG